ncbi:Membrane protein insertion efficiency factor [Candidatus Trichorickettsia mobilis]|uniref:Putative membrane protein insertion efficiency factor n=1 Tax=Candidatus Trichorickettsia mobilis TaxID=1346319 RepID=A0ABZ0UV53_9RICK|nr:membrane protein insertion efficiency factor YidD [Candidatus Trichorickettsia mobilis]WPY00502.1 Membrane protein insertion efficiency factor [Candidatus Trichorickettsia mobilis]
MKLTLIYLIKFYQFFISPWLGKNCRFYPSCSEYAKDAIMVHGCYKGVYLVLYRIIRCQPLCNGGYDPVPPLPSLDQDNHKK